MSAKDKIRTQLIEAIRDWMRQEGLTQRAAAERLGIDETNMSALLRTGRYSVGWLLDAWESCGGQWQLTLGRDRAD